MSDVNIFNVDLLLFIAVYLASHWSYLWWKYSLPKLRPFVCLRLHFLIHHCNHTFPAKFQLYCYCTFSDVILHHSHLVLFYIIHILLSLFFFYFTVIVHLLFSFTFYANDFSYSAFKMRFVRDFWKLSQCALHTQKCW